MSHQKKVIIAGSGVAGMAAAIRLSVMGFEVEVYEKNSYPGGKLYAFVKDGFHFDAGPSLFTQPKNITELFEFASVPVDEYITWQPVPVACKYFYENGKIINAYTNKAAFANELQQQLNESSAAVSRYLRDAERLYNNVGSIFLQHSLHKAATWLHPRTIKALATVRFTHLLHTLHHYNKNHFASAEAVQLFNRFATYNGSNPYQAPAMLSMIPHLEQNEGTFYPNGGMISITRALYQLALDKGVRFCFNTPVQRIIHAGGKVSGIIAGDKNIAADIIVSNADVYHTYKHLLQQDAKALKIMRQERSSSAVIFYWGINRNFDELQLHNIFFSGDYLKEFNHIFKLKQMYADPTVYINITSKTEATHAPPGMENWFVMVNAPADTGQHWDALKQKLRNIIIEKLSRLLGADIGACIVTEQTLDPLMIEQQTASAMGALYGTSSNTRFAAFLRQPNFSKSIKGLYCCGGSVHPGGGIPLCLKSAAITSNLVAADYNASKKQ
jgi:phytoene desaturase